MTQIIVEILCGIFVIHLDSEDTQTIHPGHKTWKDRFTSSGHTDKEGMTLGLSEHAVYTQNVLLCQ